MSQNKKKIIMTLCVLSRTVINFLASIVRPSTKKTENTITKPKPKFCPHTKKNNWNNCLSILIKTTKPNRTTTNAYSKIRKPKTPLPPPIDEKNTKNSPVFKQRRRYVKA